MVYGRGCIPGPLTGRALSVQVIIPLTGRALSVQVIISGVSFNFNDLFYFHCVVSHVG